MKSQRPTIGIIGCFQNGKSTLVNCLLDDKVAMTGDGRATTRLSTAFSWGEVQEVAGVCSSTNTNHAVPFHDYVDGKNIPDIELSHFEVKLWKPLLQHVNVVDTPGFEDSDQDNETAIRSLEGIDFVVFVVTNKALTQVELELLKSIAQRGLPFTVLLNCREVSRGLWEPLSAANERICEQIESSLKSAGNPPYPIHGRYVWPSNLAWFWYATQHRHGEELSESEEDLFDDVQRFMSKKLGLTKYDHAVLAEKSNFIPFRETIQRIATHHQYENSDIGKKAEKLIEQSIDHLNLKDHLTAMMFAERACYTAPGFIPALHNRAVVCFTRDEFDEAIHSSTSILEIDARNVETLFLRATAYFQKREFQKAEEDLNRISELVEGEWKISWEEAEKSSHAAKLVNACLIKVECQRRRGCSDKTIVESLRHFIEGPQQPIENVDDDKKRLKAWILSAGLEFRLKDFERSIKSSGKALAIIQEHTEFQFLETDGLPGLCELFKLNTDDVPVTGEPETLRENLLRILWKSCYQLLKIKGIYPAVLKFTEHMNSQKIPSSVWKDDPEFIPWFISCFVCKYDLSNKEAINQDEFEELISSYLIEYFQITKDTDTNSVYKKSITGVNASLDMLKNLFKLKCKVDIGTMLLMNSIKVTNTGLPVLSHFKLSVSYRENDKTKSKLFTNDGALSHGEDYKWKDAFKNKSKFFGGNKIKDIKIIKLQCAQGKVEIINGG